MIRVFLDACVLYRAALKLVSGPDTPPLSASLGIFQVAERRGDVDLLVTRYVRGEADIRLMDERLLRARAELDSLMARQVTVCPAPPIELTLRMRTYIADKFDAPVLAGAVAAGADWLVTNDRIAFGNLYETTVEGVLVMRPKAAFDRLVI